MGNKIKINKKKDKEKWNLFKDNTEILDTDMLNGLHIELFGNSKINLEGCLGVSEYKETYIKLRIKKGDLILCGENFDIVFFENQIITVKGKISSVEFSL